MTIQLEGRAQAGQLSLTSGGKLVINVEEVKMVQQNHGDFLKQSANWMHAEARNGMIIQGGKKTSVKTALGQNARELQI